MDEFPERALIFWPVGCGDSTTIVVDRENDVVVQIDLHHVGESEDQDDHRTPIVDEFVALLPERDGTPYLAAFGATHLDKAHDADRTLGPEIRSSICVCGRAENRVRATSPPSRCPNPISCCIDRLVPHPIPPCEKGAPRNRST